LSLLDDVAKSWGVGDKQLSKRITTEDYNEAIHHFFADTFGNIRDDVASGIRTNT
jgi:hypothetical protein